MLLHQRQRIGQRRLRMDGEGIDDHPGLELLDPAHQPGLLVRVEIAVDDPDAAGLGHGDRHGGLGHGVHRRGDHRDVQEDVAGDSGADVDFGGQDVGKAGLQQHVVEGESLAGGAIDSLGHAELLAATGDRDENRRRGPDRLRTRGLCRVGAGR